MSDAVEINFDGLIGPMHNYAGLSAGNVASARNAHGTSQPKTAALQGLAKMRRLIERGLAQGFFPPLRRPDTTLLRRLGFGGSDQDVLSTAAAEDPLLFNNICSASSMWAANAATVIAAPESGDARVHLVPANLSTMLHRSIEGPQTEAMLRSIFKDNRYFSVHSPLPSTQHFSDEGAANHMRLAPSHGGDGINVFVHGAARGSRFPERQAKRAGEAVARVSGVTSALHTLQSQAAIEAGAFHNDVVAVANEYVLLAHAEAFEHRDDLFGALDAVPGFTPVEIDSISLEDAVTSYLFNSQLVTLPEGGMALILPAETQANPRVKNAIDAILAANNPINEAIIVDVRESMRNGGGPACLRLRVPVAAEARAAIDQRYLLDARRMDALSELVERHWPAAIAPGELTNPALWSAAYAAHDALDSWLAQN